MIQQTARDFANNEIMPVADELSRQGKYPADIVAKLSELGFMGMLIPEEYGGNGLGNFNLVLALEEVNRACASTGVTMSVHNSLCSGPIVNFAGDDLKKTIEETDNNLKIGLKAIGLIN